MIILSFSRGLLIFSLSNPWNIYIILLVFLGGIIVLICYIRTLTLNDKFIFENKYSVLYTCTLIILLSFMFTQNEKIIFWKISDNHNSIKFFYDIPNMCIFIFLIVYLLFCIVVVVKIVSIDKGPIISRL